MSDYKTEVVSVIEAGRVRGLTPTECLALHEQLGYQGALDCIATFGSWASASASTVYQRRRAAMEKDVPVPTQGGGTNAAAPVAAHESEPPTIDAEAIYARRRAQLGA